MRIKKAELKAIIKEELSAVLSEKVDRVAMKAVMEWAIGQGKEMLRDDVVVEGLKKWAEKILENPAIRGGQLGTMATKLVGGALGAYAVYQMYQDMSEMVNDPNKSAEWNDGIADGLDVIGAGLAKHGMPTSPKYWGVDSCDDLHGFALKNACARWERKEQIATSPKAAERQGGGKQWQNRIYPPIKKGGGYRTWEELSAKERRSRKMVMLRMRWREKAGKQRRGHQIRYRRREKERSGQR